MYMRQTVRIELACGKTISAETYVVQPAYLNHLEKSDWDFAGFLRLGKENFQRHYRGYHAI